MMSFKALFPCAGVLACTLGNPGAVGASETSISGSAKVQDGDTLVIAGQRVDLHGIDAPELSQTCDDSDTSWNCGAQAKETLARIVGDRRVECRATGTSPERNIAAVCTAGTTDLGEAMLSGGMAMALPDAPPAYIAAQDRLKALRFGIWKTPFAPPADWRAAHAPTPVPQEQVTGAATAAACAKPVQARERVYRNRFGCAIKGNRNRKGEWIYHLPGSPYYEKTRPEELFCTEPEAQRAGYRRSKA